MTPRRKRTQRMDVSCRLFFVAEIEQTLMDQGSGFLTHVLEQEALRLLKEGNPRKDFHLTVISAGCLPGGAHNEEEGSPALLILADLLRDPEGAAAYLAAHREQLHAMLPQQQKGGNA